MLACSHCGATFASTNQLLRHERSMHEEEVPTIPAPGRARKDSLDNSEPPPGDNGWYVGRMEYRSDRRETRLWRESNDARLRQIEKRLTLVGLAIAAATAASNGTVPWGKIAQALGW